MGNFNPNATTKLGLEWFPTLERTGVLDSFGKCVIARVPSLATENIGTVSAYCTIADAGAGNRRWELEIVPVGSEAVGTITALQALPNEDVSISHASGSPVDSAGNRYQNIDDESDTDFITVGDGTGLPASYIYRLATGGLSLTGKRMLYVDLIYRISYPSVMGNASAVGISVSGVDYYASSTSDFTEVLASGAAAGTTYVTRRYRWYVNPNTGDPWTIAAVQAFDTSDEFWIYTTGASAVNLYWARLEVGTCTENRVARGSKSSLAVGVNTWTVTTPTGGTWSKTNGVTYAYIFRRGGSSSWVGYSTAFKGLEAAAAVPMNHGSVLAGTLTAERTVDAATQAAASGLAALMLVPITTAPANSNDAQPYASLGSAQVYNGQTAQQEISGAAATAYSLVDCLVQHGGAPDADLLVKVKRRSDNVQLGGTLTLTRAAIDALPDAGGGWKRVTAPLASTATLATATQYYLEFSSTATNAALNRWLVAYLDADAAQNQGYGGTTDRGTVNGSEADDYDLPATIATAPTAPANPAVAGTSVALAGDGSDCSLTSLSIPRFSWDATALGGSFSHYEVQRSEDAGATWVDIAEITVEATHQYDDIEARRGVQSCYRVRVVRTDGAPSDWTAQQCITPTDPTCGVNAWLFVSGAEPTRSVGYNIPPERVYEFLTGDEIVRRKLHGRDYQVAFVPLEQRGVQFTLDLLVNVNRTPPTGAGIRAFSTLRALCEASDLPYIAVLDSDGNRFFASVQLVRGVHAEPFQQYHAEVLVVELTDTPTVVSVP